MKSSWMTVLSAMVVFGLSGQVVWVRAEDSKSPKKSVVQASSKAKTPAKAILPETAKGGTQPVQEAQQSEAEKAAVAPDAAQEPAEETEKELVNETEATSGDAGVEEPGVLKEEAAGGSEEAGGGEENAAPEGTEEKAAPAGPEGEEVPEASGKYTWIGEMTSEEDEGEASPLEAQTTGQFKKSLEDKPADRTPAPKAAGSAAVAPTGPQILPAGATVQTK